MDHVYHAECGSLRSGAHKPVFPGKVCVFYKRGHCIMGDHCSRSHQNPENTNFEGLDDPFLVEFLAKVIDCPVPPPEDQSVKMIYVRRLHSTGILEQDLRDRFSAYGDIESIRMVAERRGCAFITFTTRLAADKAMDDLKTWVELKGHRLKVLWAYTYMPERFTTISNPQGFTCLDHENPMDQTRFGAYSSTSLPQTRIGAYSSTSSEMPPDKRRKIE